MFLLIMHGRRSCALWKRITKIASLVAVTTILLQSSTTNAQHQQPELSTSQFNYTLDTSKSENTTKQKTSETNEIPNSTPRKNATDIVEIEETTPLHQNTTDYLFSTVELTTDQSVDNFTTGKDLIENYVTSSPSAINDYETKKPLTDATAHLNNNHNNYSSTEEFDDSTNISLTTKLLTDSHSSAYLNTQNSTENDAKYVKIAFVTRNPQEPAAKYDSTTNKDERSTRQDASFDNDTKVFKFWTILKSDVSSKINSDLPNENTEKTQSLKPNKIYVVKDNVPLSGHLVTLPPIQVTEKNNSNSIKSDCKLKNQSNLCEDNASFNKSIDSSFESDKPQFYANFERIKTINESTTSTYRSNGESRTTLSLHTPSSDNGLAKNSEDFDLDAIEGDPTSAADAHLSATRQDGSQSDDLAKTIAVNHKHIMEAADYGIMMMNDFYDVQEPKLYQMGLSLEADSPARYLASFNWQSDEAKKLTRFGYAALQAAARLQQISPLSLEGREAGRGSTRTPWPRTSALREQCPLRGDPRCPPASKRYRTHDGTCNNLRRLRWGSALTSAQRFLAPNYSDGLQAPRRGLPSARRVSASVHAGHAPAPRAVTHLLMQWGQLLDHDITATAQARGFNGSVPRCCRDGGRSFVPLEQLHPECMPIVVPEDDSFYGPLGIRCLEFLRSAPAPRHGCEPGWREQLNQVTAYVDGSPMYGSSARQSDKLRLFRNGLLQYGRAQARRPLLPPSRDDAEALCLGGAVDASCFKAGDGRVNEHPGLVAMHIVWLRKHNRLATELSHVNPHWSDEKVYQETRKIIGALIQHITYKEFLPIVLGSEVIRLFDLELMKKGYYDGYSSKVNPNPANSFGAAAFRFGHSLVQDSFMRYDRFHRPLPNNVSLHEELTNPSNIWSFGAVDRLLLGMCNQPAQRRDEFITPELTNHLFQTSRLPFGMDLAAINLQRGRDHGLPAYSAWREPCGLTPVRSWKDLLAIMPARAVRKMELIYRSVDDVDLFTGGLSERPVIGGLVGPTFACIIAQQFSNLRRGDRFWYENGGFESSLTPAQLQQIRRVTLAQVLCQTMETMDTVQPFVFLSADDFRNERISCDSNILNNFDLSPWTERIPDFNNNINTFDRFNRHKLTTGNPHFSSLFSDNFPSSTFSGRQTTEQKLTSSPSTSVPFDGKLDLPDKSSTEPPSDSQNLTKLTDETTLTRQTNEPSNMTTPKIIIDDKLDFSAKTIDPETNHENSTKEVALDKRIFSNISELIEKTNSSEIFEGRDNSNQDTSDFTGKLFRNKNNSNQAIDIKTAVKTYGFLLNDESSFPFLDTIFSSTKTTTQRTPIRPLYIRPQINVYENVSPTTESPGLYTYLINIVPKTTPKYQTSNNKNAIKITVQGPLSHTSGSQSNSFPYNKRPVYNNNRLEYRPVTETNYDSGNDNDNNYGISQQTFTRPTTRPDYQTNNFYNKLPPSQSNPNIFLNSYVPENSPPLQNSDRQPTYGQIPSFHRPNRPYKPTSDHDHTTESGPYNLVTFSHIETTKRYDLFDRPNFQYDNHQNDNYKPNPTTSSDSGYGINPRPVRPQTKPTNTGITIYIESKPTRPRPLQDNSSGGNGGYAPSGFNPPPIIQNQYSDSEEDVPLFSRPNYQKPFHTRPVRTTKPPTFDNSRPDKDTVFNDYNKPLQSEHGQITGAPSYGSNFRPSTNKPTYHDPYGTSNENIYFGTHKNSPNFPWNSGSSSTTKRPHLQRPNGVNLNLASEYGSQPHSGISIVIDPNLRHGDKSNPKRNFQPVHEFSQKLNRPDKFYYIGNVLHKYADSKVDDATPIEDKAVHSQIIKENYNNAWRPDENEHKLFYGSYDDDVADVEDNDDDDDDDDELEPYAGINGNMKEEIDTTNITKDSFRNFDRKTDSDNIKNKKEGNLRGSLSSKRGTLVKAPPLKSSESNKKDNVFFDVIPSENSPTMWVVYNEKPEENLPHYYSNKMPPLDSDPQALHELPRPMNFASKVKRVNHKHSRK